MTQDLQELANWLKQFEVTQVAMESSGVYWKPVWNLLEGQFTVVLVNAQLIKNVPGCRTDQKDMNRVRNEPKRTKTDSPICLILLGFVVWLV